MTALAPTLEAFFTGRLINEKGVSPHTIAAYRDTFRLLLAFAQTTHRQTAVQARDRGSRRAVDHRVPRPPRARPRQQPHEPGTRAWQRSTRCSASPRCAIPSTPR